MAKKKKKKKISARQRRSIRTQQIIMGIVGVLIILSMVISMIAK
jgi:predicted nucleic acid-binding Zn ribbon protein